MADKKIVYPIEQIMYKVFVQPSSFYCMFEALPLKS